MRTPGFPMPAKSSQSLHSDLLERMHHRVANASVKMETSKDACIHPSFDGITGTTVWRRYQVQDGRADRVLEPITKSDVGYALQHLPDNLVHVATLISSCRYSLQGQVDVHC